MAINSAKDAVAKSMRARTNKVGMCQQVVRGWFNAPSVGDVDKDDDADAVDGWKSEPASKRHTDRNPPAGVPVAYSGGSRGHGHRALSLGNGKIRTTDGNGNGKVATQNLDWPEKHWGMKYLGWSETISGKSIPGVVLPGKKPTAKKPTAKKAVAKPAVSVDVPKSRGKKIDQALKLLESSARTSAKARRHVGLAIDAVKAIPYI